MNTNSIAPKVSKNIFEQTINTAFRVIGEPDPDSQAFLEVQKAAVQFVSTVLQSADKKKNQLKLEDIIYHFRNQQKYLDACIRKQLKFEFSQAYKKYRNHEDNQQNVIDEDEEIRSIMNQQDDDVEQQQQ